ncbi:hypothetical protein [Marivita sp.]|uniref:hypothetical protein n=1 Tax=Marivita sp. TaxID=2003365 RepID=UPI0025BCE6EA|nr:hypothetical protein [Marivita sp.]
MLIAGFCQRLLSGGPLAGAALRTPAHQVTEVLDFVGLDVSLAPWGKATKPRDRVPNGMCCVFAAPGHAGMRVGATVQ